MIDLYRILRMILMVPALLIVLVVRIIRPLFLVRFGMLHSSRIGHLAGNTEVYLAERESGMHPRGWLGGIDLWAHFGQPCNEQLARMISRSLWVDRTGLVRLLFVANGTFHGWERHHAASINWDRDITGALAKTKQHLQFTPEELQRGRDQLAAWGLKPGDKWVCLVARDSAYLDSSFDYHKYRDTKISTYRLAALELAKRGYHVFRMGAKVREPFHVEHPMIADYATNGMRSDFMDVYLMAHCTFALTNGTGIDAVATIFRRPMCFVNYVPLEYMSTMTPGLVIWKHHWRDGKRMSFNEIFSSGAAQYQRAENYKAAGITLKDNTAHEIRAVTIEMCKFVDGHHYEDDQSEFWYKFPLGAISNDNGRPIHGVRVIRIGSKFLESYQ